MYVSGPPYQPNIILYYDITSSTPAISLAFNQKAKQTNKKLEKSWRHWKITKTAEKKTRFFVLHSAEKVEAKLHRLLPKVWQNLPLNFNCDGKLEVTPILIPPTNTKKLCDDLLAFSPAMIPIIYHCHNLLQQKK